MSVTVHIPTPLRPFVGNQDTVTLEDVASIKDVFQKLVGDNAELSKYILAEDGSIRNFVNVYLNEEDIRYLEGDSTSVKDDDVISIVPSIAGGYS